MPSFLKEAYRMWLRTTLLAALLIASLFSTTFKSGPVRAQTTQYGPRLEHLQFVVLPTFDVQQLAMRRGDVDVLVNLTFNEARVLWGTVVTIQGWDAYQPYLRGAMRWAFDWDSWNYWTVCNLYWDAGHEHLSDFNFSWTKAIFTLKDHPQYPPNPAWVDSTLVPANPTWDQLSWIYDSLIGVNPYMPFVEMHQLEGCHMLDGARDPDFPETPGYLVEDWLVTDGPMAGYLGMKVTFYLNTEIPIFWHDGHRFDAYDIAFAWEYLAANKIPETWSTFQWLHHTEVNHPLNDTITAYMTYTKLDLVRGLSTCGPCVPFPLMYLWGQPRMFPEHIWGCTHGRGGRATPACEWVNRADAWNAQLEWINTGDVNGTAGTKPLTDSDALVESGLCLCDVGTQDPAGGKLSCVHNCGCVLDDRDTLGNEILDYNPEAYPNPTPAYPWLTELIGTGPYVWYGYDPVGGIGNLIAFDERTHETVMPGVHYWKPTDKIHDELVEMFWMLGDVDLNGQIRVVWDLATMGFYYMLPVPPAPWRADINKDGIIDICDLSTAGRNYGIEREV